MDKLTGFFTELMRKYLPDPFVFAIILTLLTLVLAIFVGAFTLTLTNGLGTGINRFIDSTVSSIGASNVLTVSKTSTNDPTSTAPRKYDPDAIASAQTGPGRPGTSNAVSALTEHLTA